MLVGQHFSFPSSVLFLWKDYNLKVCSGPLPPFTLELILVFAKLLTFTLCRKTAEKLLHISSFSLVLKLVLLLYHNPYCVCVVVDCSRSELPLRLWTYERSLKTGEDRTRHCSQQLVSSWFLNASVLLFNCSVLAFGSSVSICCVLSPYVA